MSKIYTDTFQLHINQPKSKFLVKRMINHCQIFQDIFRKHANLGQTWVTSMTSLKNFINWESLKTYIYVFVYQSILANLQFYHLQNVCARGRFSIRFSTASFSSRSACSLKLFAASTELSSMSLTSVTGSKSVIGRISIWLSASNRSVTTLRQ